eukprot:jgi/Mesvir1/7456/Mv25811-RA.1
MTNKPIRAFQPLHKHATNSHADTQPTPMQAIWVRYLPWWPCTCYLVRHNTVIRTTLLACCPCDQQEAVLCFIVKSSSYTFLHTS